MKKQFIKKMQKKLVEEKFLILKETYSETNDQSIDSDGDEVDEVQANLLVYVSNQINSRHSASIKKIDQALERIRNDEYGFCEDCEEEISEKRLEFNPYFTTCIKCAEIREKINKQMR